MVKYKTAKELRQMLKDKGYPRYKPIEPETLLVNAKPGTGDKQLKNYYESILKKDEGAIV